MGLVDTPGTVPAQQTVLAAMALLHSGDHDGAAALLDGLPDEELEDVAAAAEMVATDIVSESGDAFAMRRLLMHRVTVNVLETTAVVLASGDLELGAKFLQGLIARTVPHPDGA